ncbi:MAG: membrane protein insertion efficiency factor YidD [Candidatus Fermentithermobacillus carboniphilus]|uniref:Putative membrane protein insertion efficiency factor n=1 Tax=Candidatus Fermentithermobacillus carboniphilus TaxID=3085328 RepID=A0AAT9LD76_9FIRM|nr:MAG: membrane protein insertion efficiency factor YidD [Candidatus Fermentithermobacillus carboniphilus]
MLTKILVFLIGLYQKYLSPLKGPTCRFYPSCSEYARQAIIVHGPFRGTLLALWRLFRCNPFSPGGYDPVPEKKEPGSLGPRRFRRCHT